MIKEINIIRCTCDICKTNFDIKDNEEIPLEKLRLPMKYYGESGGFISYITERIDVCEECLKQLEEDLSKHYDLSSAIYRGVRISKKEGADNA